MAAKKNKTKTTPNKNKQKTPHKNKNNKKLKQTKQTRKPTPKPNNQKCTVVCPPVLLTQHTTVSHQVVKNSSGYLQSYSCAPGIPMFSFS